MPKFRKMTGGKTIIISVLLTFFFGIADAQTVTVDKQTYTVGETISITGSGLDAGSATMQILDPYDTLKEITPVIINPAGTFSSTTTPAGDNWQLEGTYTIKLFLNPSMIYTTTFELVKPPDRQDADNSRQIQDEPDGEPNVLETPPQSPPLPTLQPAPQTPAEPSPEPAATEIVNSVRIKDTHISGFPALDKTPQYYIDRYNTESAYKEWFDSQFPANTISDIVGYEQTHISGFPALDKTPQYYIDRYNTESAYKEWFDSQFPAWTIYQVLGFPDPATVPDWLKEHIRLWSAGSRGDDGLVSDINYMAQNGILDGDAQENYDVPDWFRKNALWWHAGTITDKEFTDAIQYLVDMNIV